MTTVRVVSLFQVEALPDSSFVNFSDRGLRLQELTLNHAHLL